MIDGELFEGVARLRDGIFAQLRKVIVGQQEVADLMLIALLARGHALLTGAPGLGKTLLVRTLSDSLSLCFKRIQFTPDLMPSDICGTEVVEEDAQTGKRSFRFVPGPIFANILLADEINRTPPKTQAALLEAMQEYQVTAGGTTHSLKPPFLVLATQNPIELEGTYPLPEAQLDRFLLNILVDYLPEVDEVDMVLRTTAASTLEVEAVVDADKLLEIQVLTRKVPVARELVEYAVRLVNATRPSRMASDSPLKSQVRWGAGSRASQSLILAGKARALMQARPNVSLEDIQAVAPSVLRHRIIPSFQAETEGVDSDQIVQDAIARTEV